MSVKQCQRTIDAREFAEWLVYAQLEPWDETRADLRAGIVASTIANIWRGADNPPYAPHDFMPDYDPVESEPVDEEASIELTQAIFENLTTQMGGTIIG